MPLFNSQHISATSPKNVNAATLPCGLGTFVWKPTVQGEWGQGLFVDGAATDTINLYDLMAEDYGLR